MEAKRLRTTMLVTIPRRVAMLTALANVVLAVNPLRRDRGAGACFLAACPGPAPFALPKLCSAFPGQSLMVPPPAGPAGLRRLSITIQAVSAKSGTSDGRKKDWRGHKSGRGGGGRNRRGGGELRGPSITNEADLAATAELAGVRDLLAAGGKVIVLGIGKARLFYEGNPVVFGGAVGAVLGEPSAGDVVSVTDHAGKLVGWGIYNPDSMYRVRMLWLNSIDGPAGASRDVAATLVERLRTAIAVRKSLRLPRTDTNAYRLVNGEGDRMSGIVIDVYDKLLVVSSSARWVELYKEQVIAAVSSHFADDYEVIWRLSKDRLRQDGWTPGTAEDLPPDSFAEASSEASQGASDDSQNAPALEEEMVVQEFGVKFAVSPRVGQKTGHYCDQRDNRHDIGLLCDGLTVLDSFCYSAGFGISAALKGASAVDCVDSSAPALALAARNGELNGVTEKMTFTKADVGAFLDASVQEGRQWDCIILDPPKLAPRRNDLERAKGKYKKLNKAALGCVRPGGLLLSCTCSSAMAQTDELVAVIRQAAAEAGRQVTLVRTYGAAGDHPINPAFPEGTYLKGYLLAVQ